MSDQRDEQAVAPTDKEIRDAIYAYEGALSEADDNPDGIDEPRAALLNIMRQCRDCRATAAEAALAARPAAICVRESEMRESNGRVTYGVFLAKSPDQSLFDCHQIYADSIKGRAQYEAANLRHFLGQGDKPNILAFDTDAPARPAEDGLAERLLAQCSAANACCLKEKPSEREMRGVIGGLYIVANEAAAALGRQA